MSSRGPLKVYAAIRESDNARALLFEASIDEAPNARASFEADGIAVHEERDFAERIYRLSVTLERPDLSNIFEIVVADLVEMVQEKSSAMLGVSTLLSRLSAWQAFLRARRAGLGQEAIVGLFGELTILRILSGQIGMSAAVEAWQGPFEGLHDFVRCGGAVEVTTGSGAASSVNIASLDQLSDTGFSALLLAHVHLVEQGNGMTLPDLVKSLSEMIMASAPAMLRLFKDGLLAAGYVDADAAMYATRTYSVVAINFYDVTGDFPRLVRSEVPAAITEASYRLELRSLRPYLAPEALADAVFRQMGGQQ
jgi:hypothetical protein